MIKKWMKDAFYQADGTLDLSRVLMALGCLAFIAQGIFALLWKGQTFDAQAYGIGFGALLGGSGAGVMWHGRAN